MLYLVMMDGHGNSWVLVLVELRFSVIREMDQCFIAFSLKSRFTSCLASFPEKRELN